ncbi:hypothetical protein [Bradyrhizobium yuanmingense]|uniref:hypothetical protein n=1 Tax=Bradyrhizobium yuanmingense TaxID=108015 RepID=UPI0023B92318|nr:hypothetical protein [Bradyrhizobium yuanmingense]MDF0584959.1 hypothetical protein [Bradyrhizobium yuanmingense]
MHELQYWVTKQHRGEPLDPQVEQLWDKISKLVDGLFEARLMKWSSAVKRERSFFPASDDDGDFAGQIAAAIDACLQGLRDADDMSGRVEAAKDCVDDFQNIWDGDLDDDQHGPSGLRINQSSTS